MEIRVLRYFLTVVKEQMDKGQIDIGLLLESVDIEKYEFIRLDTRRGRMREGY